MEQNIGTDEIISQPGPSRGSQPPPLKKSRFGDWFEGDNREDPALGNEIEVDFYLKVGVPDDDDPAKVLDWWRAKSAIFTRLAKLARRVLAIPGTSATSERTLSRAGLIITDKRSRIDPKRVSDLLVIHNYYLVSIFFK